jgi:hypothetical protein
MKIATMVIVRVLDGPTGNTLSENAGPADNVILPRPGDYVVLDVVDENNKATEKSFKVMKVLFKYTESIRPIINIEVRGIE